MIIALVALLILMRRPRGNEGLPGPIVAALVMTAAAYLTASFWLVNLAAFITVIWILQMVSAPPGLPPRGHRPVLRKLKGTRRATPERCGQWPQLKLELNSASRELEAEVQQQGREVGQPETGRVALPQGGSRPRRVSLGKRTEPAEGEGLAAARSKGCAGRIPEQRGEVMRSISDLLTQVQGQLPPEAVAALRDLDRGAEEARAYLQSRGLQDGHLGQLLRQTVQDYAPGAVNAYLRLPASVADSVKLQDDKTGRDLLMEQLGMLKRAVSGILEHAARAESQPLLAHQRFLEQKLERRKRDFEL